MKLLVTGGAGFIGSAFIRHVHRGSDASIVNVDALTYAANPAALEHVAQSPRYRFEKADIADARAMAAIIAGAPAGCDRQYRGRDPCRPLDRRPGRLHPDQRRRHVDACSTRRGSTGARCRASAAPRFRFHHVSTDEVFGSLAPGDPASVESSAVSAELALCREQGRRRPSRARLAQDLRPAGGDDQLLEQLWPVAVSGEADPADDPQGAGRREACRSTAPAPTSATGSMSRTTPAGCGWR